MKLLSFLSLTAALAFIACDSKQNEAREKGLENHADRLEDQVKTTKKIAADDADAIKKDADAKADALKKEADRTREQK